MWIILVNKNLSEYRDESISKLFGNQTNNVENFLSKYSTYKYNAILDIKFAKIFKTKSGAERFIKRFNSSNRNSYSSKFHWIKDNHLSCRKLTIDEWNKIIDSERILIEQKDQKELSKLEIRKKEYRNEN